MGNSRSGFASLSPERHREIAASGGGSKKRDPRTRSYNLDTDLAKRAGRKGGLARAKKLIDPANG